MKRRPPATAAGRRFTLPLDKQSYISDGCSSAKSSEPPLPDAATLLKESSETTRNLNSAHLDIKVNGSIPNLPVHTLTGDLTNTPAVAAKGNANITLRGQTLALATRFRRPQRPHPQKLARAVAANRPALVTSDMSALRM